MNTLVTISNNQPVVSSRSVAENFGKLHKHVLDSIVEILGSAEFSATPLFHKTVYIHPQNKQQYPEYLMTRDGFTLLAMSFTGSKALAWKLKYIQAFNDMEQQLKNPFEIPKTFSEALMLAAEQQKTIELQQGEIQVLTPKAQAFDDFISGEGYYNMGSAAKILGYGRNLLFAKLREYGILMRDNIPYQKFVNLGYFVVKANSKQGKSFSTTLVSAKGVSYLREAIC